MKTRRFFGITVALMVAALLMTSCDNGVPRDTLNLFEGYRITSWETTSAYGEDTALQFVRGTNFINYYAFLPDDERAGMGELMIGPAITSGARLGYDLWERVIVTGTPYEKLRNVGTGGYLSLLGTGHQFQAWEDWAWNRPIIRPLVEEYIAYFHWRIEGYIIRSAIQPANLLSMHTAFDNFYNEWAHGSVQARDMPENWGTSRWVFVWRVEQ